MDNPTPTPQVLYDSYAYYWDRYLHDEAMVSLEECVTVPFGSLDGSIIHYVTAIIHGSGSIDGFFGLSLSKELAVLMVKAYIQDHYEPSEEAELIESVTGEVLNVVLGHAIKSFGSISKIGFESPLAVIGDVNIEPYKRGGVIGHNNTCTAGQYTLMYLY